MHIDIVAVGKNTSRPIKEICAEYQKRLKWSVSVHEIQIKDRNPSLQKEKECSALLKKIDNDTIVIALDETGENISSQQFSSYISKQQNNGHNNIAFIIGGADGLNDEIRSRSNKLLSFGRLTWPHMMVRALLMEQIYRAQQIISGHPYHRG